MNNGEHTGLIVGVTVVYIPIILLALAVVIVVLGIVLYIKRANINQKRYGNYHNFKICGRLHRKSDNDIVMECSPAYATTEFTTVSYIIDYYIKYKILIDQQLSQCMTQLGQSLLLLFHYLLNMKYQLFNNVLIIVYSKLMMQ